MSAVRPLLWRALPLPRAIPNAHRAALRRHRFAHKDADGFLVTLFGDDLWRVLEPARSSFLPAYYCSTPSACLAVAAIGATFLASARSGRGARQRLVAPPHAILLPLFVAPFVVLLLLPTTSFIDIPERSASLREHARPGGRALGSAMLSVAARGAGVCEQPPDQWGSYLLAQAEADGRILNESTARAPTPSR